MQTISIFGSQTVVATRNEFEITTIPQILQLLANLWLHKSVARVKLTQLIRKRIDIIDLKFAFPNRGLVVFPILNNSPFFTT